MKKYILILTLFFSVAVPTFAQQKNVDKADKVEALYIAFVTKQLNLSSDDAQKFWPIHAQYDNEIKAVSIDLNELDRQQSVLNIKKKYQDRFVKVLGADRTNTFFATDNEFRKRMVDRLRKLRENKKS